MCTYNMWKGAGCEISSFWDETWNILDRYSCQFSFTISRIEYLLNGKNGKKSHRRHICIYILKSAEWLENRMYSNYWPFWWNFLEVNRSTWSNAIHIFVDSAINLNCTSWPLGSLASERFLESIYNSILLKTSESSML